MDQTTNWGERTSDPLAAVSSTAGSNAARTSLQLSTILADHSSFFKSEKRSGKALCSSFVSDVKMSAMDPSLFTARLDVPAAVRLRNDTAADLLPLTKLREKSIIWGLGLKTAQRFVYTPPSTLRLLSRSFNQSEHQLTWCEEVQYWGCVKFTLVR